MPSEANNQAYAVIKGVLDTYGLGSLADWAWDRIVEGKSEPEILQDLRATDEYKTRFRGIILREQAGLPAMSPAQVVEYEDRAGELMRFYDMPPGFYDEPADFAEMIGHNLGLSELEKRVTLARDAAESSPPEVLAELQTKYGVNIGGLAAFFLDEERGLQQLQRQFTAAQISGTARRQGFGPLTTAEAERLYAAGIDAEAAQQAFGMLGESGQITGQLVGEQAPAMTREAELAVAEGSQAAVTELERRRAKRHATFAEGGGFATGSEGVGGAGSSET